MHAKNRMCLPELVGLKDRLSLDTRLATRCAPPESISLSVIGQLRDRDFEQPLTWSILTRSSRDISCIAFDHQRTISRTSLGTLSDERPHIGHSPAHHRPLRTADIDLTPIQPIGTTGRIERSPDTELFQRRKEHP